MTSTPTRPVDNVVIATKGLHDRNINILAGTTVENKGKFILIVAYCLNYIALLNWNKKCPGMAIPKGEGPECTICTILFADDQVVIAQEYDDIEFMVRKKNMESVF